MGLLDGKIGADLRRRERPLDRLGDRPGAPCRGRGDRLLLDRVADRASASDRSPNPSARPSSSPATSSRDEDIDRVFDRWQATHDGLDILVHALAFAKREDLTGRFVDTSRDGFALAQDVSAYSLVAHHPGRAARPPARLVGPHAHLLRRREGRRQLQRDGRREGVAGGVGPLSGGGPRARRDPGQRDQRRARCGRSPRPGSAGFKKMYGEFADVAPLRANITIEDVGRTAVYLASRPVISA